MITFVKVILEKFDNPWMSDVLRCDGVRVQIKYYSEQSLLYYACPRTCLDCIHCLHFNSIIHPGKNNRLYSYTHGYGTTPFRYRLATVRNGLKLNIDRNIDRIGWLTYFYQLTVHHRFFDSC